uniref:Uncharacterized protein n=1 Tax=Oryza glumipatula TaxID=40148 RepID=A0A0E0AF10_9ORYZ
MARWTSRSRSRRAARVVACGGPPDEKGWQQDRGREEFAIVDGGTVYPGWTTSRVAAPTAGASLHREPRRSIGERAVWTLHFFVKGRRMDWSRPMRKRRRSKVLSFKTC